MLSNFYTVDFGEVAALFTLQVLILAAGYIFSASFEIWGINWLKQVFNIELAIFSAMLLNAYWPLQYILYKVELSKLSEPRVVTPEMYRSYIILGGLAALISVTRCYGIVALPPLLYVITANTEICWESFMTYFVLGRRIDMYQQIAVLMVIAGLAISLSHPSQGSNSASSSGSTQAIFAGVMLSLTSRFLSSLNTILAEKFLGKDRKSAIGVTECSFSNSIIPFFTIPLLYTVMPEYRYYASDFTGYSHGYTALLVFICLGIALAKMMDRLCKFSLVTQTSTMFFASVDCSMKIIAGIGSLIFFNETISWQQIVGFTLIIMSFIPMRYGSHKEKEHTKRLADAFPEEGDGRESHVVSITRLNVPSPGPIDDPSFLGRISEAITGKSGYRDSMGSFRPSLSFRDRDSVVGGARLSARGPNKFHMQDLSSLSTRNPMVVIEEEGQCEEDGGAERVPKEAV